jgi:3-dehydroquinate dehydratase-2
VSAAARIAVVHGVNFDVLERRRSDLYGGLTLAELERRIAGYASELGLHASFFQTNSERELVEYLHGAPSIAEGLIVNPGAWTHYAWAIHDALELAGLPAVEVHLSDVARREPWRAVSVVRDLCVSTYAGYGVEGYRMALERLRDVLAADRAHASQQGAALAPKGSAGPGAAGPPPRPAGADAERSR